MLCGRTTFCHLLKVNKSVKSNLVAAKNARLIRLFFIGFFGVIDLFGLDTDMDEVFNQIQH